MCVNAGAFVVVRQSMMKWMLFQMKWTECLQGAGSLRETMSDLADLTGARVALLYRCCEMTGRSRMISALDRGARAGERPVTIPIGPSLLSASARGAKAGTLWTLADLDRSEREGLDQRSLLWSADRRLKDAAVVPLDRSSNSLDLLELHFPSVLDAPLRAELEIAAVAASAAWRRRAKGRIARLLSATPGITERLAREVQSDRVSPLSPANPLGLTAAEMRICALLSSGYPAHAMTSHLKISESTLRTHLRSIYAKAGVGGQVDLVHLLLSSGTGQPAWQAG